METGIWIALGLLTVVLLVSCGKSKTSAGGGSAGVGKNNKRIDHLHYIDLDEYECPKCGARFRKNVMVCPKCGAKFSGTVEDEDEFIEEMVLWDEDEESD